MTVDNYHFKVSSGLKDLIGRDLITNDFVAMFELVKNSFDAHATSVRLFFENDKIVISDNGKGMSRDDILKKWLFVAYSAKRDGTEDQDYHSESGPQDQPFAGSKGIGRFACDRLGKQLFIFSRAASSPIQELEIDWTHFEDDAQQIFGDVGLEIRETEEFPEPHLKPDGDTGTVLEIRRLRSEWNRDRLLRLKRELARLINPFAPHSQQLQIELLVPDEKAMDDDQKQRWEKENKGKNSQELVNGKIENTIMRGIAMAEVAEMENVMGQTLIQVFQSSDDQIARTKQKTIQDVRNRVQKIPNHLEKRLEESGFSGVVQDSSLFSLTHKYRVIKRLARLLPSGHSDQSRFLNAFEQDVIQNRNLLAHAQERMTEDGTPVLYSKISGKSKEKIDDGWMSDCRKKIQEHKSAVDVICTSLKEQFNAEELAGNSE